ncbi:UNVERIFIED_CONTAM: hypothetical protein GTU68_048231 [Idotea baltica]|nr:hypothetical protein [Idotea baltica]
MAKTFQDAGLKNLHLVDLDGAKIGSVQHQKILEKIKTNTDLIVDYGGGIRNESDVVSLKNAGADQVNIGSLSIKNKVLIKQFIEEFGQEYIILSPDVKGRKIANAKKIDGKWLVHLVGGRKATNIDLFEWIKEAVDRGAGEILFTSMDHDGTKNGFANDELSKISKMVNVPIIASGGAGNMDHFRDTFDKGLADAALAASVFHFGEISIPDLKNYLADQKINVRLN